MSIVDDFIKVLGIFNITVEQPELDRIAKEFNEGKFDDAQNVLDGVRDAGLGTSEFQQLPQDLQDRADRLGGEVVKLPDGSFDVLTGDVAGFERLGLGTVVSRDRPQQQQQAPNLFDIAETGIGRFEDIRENVLGRFGDLESALIPGFQNREQSILDSFANLQGGLNQQAQGRTETGMALINRLMGELQGGFGQLQSNVQGGFGDLRGDLLSALQGSGAQERIDINETFDNLGDATRAGLISSGLSGSTILPSLQADVARQRTGAQGRLDERLLQQRLGVIGDTGFGALRAQENIGLAGLGAQEGLGTFGAGLFQDLSGDALNLAEGLGIFGTELQGQLSGETLGAIQGLGALGIGLEAETGGAVANAEILLNQLPINFQQGLLDPQIGLILSQLMQPGVGISGLAAQFLQSTLQPDTPEQPSTFEGLAPGLIGGTAALGSAGILATAGTVAPKAAGAPLTGGLSLAACIDGNAILKMPDKQRMLKDIEVGDKVLSARGDYVEVVWKDYGSPAEVNEYVELSCGAYSIIATIDHHIGGKAAGEWRIGEEMEFFNDKHCLLESVKKVGPVLCGDIRLADDSDYIASGFVVTSQQVRIANDVHDTPTVKQTVAA